MFTALGCKSIVISIWYYATFSWPALLVNSWYAYNHRNAYQETLVPLQNLFNFIVITLRQEQWRLWIEHYVVVHDGRRWQRDLFLSIHKWLFIYYSVKHPSVSKMRNARLLSPASHNREFNRLYQDHSFSGDTRTRVRVRVQPRHWRLSYNTSI